MSRTRLSHFGLVLCLAGTMAASGCAAGGWGRLMGKKKDEPSPKLTLAWSKLKEDEGRLTEARSGYESVLAKEPKNVEALLGLARLDEKAQRLVKAEEGYASALALQPKSPRVLSEVGKFYSQQQRWEKAIPLLQDAQRIEPHEKSHQFNLGMALTKAGRSDEALPHFTEAVGEAAAHYNIGRLLIESGKSAEAEKQFTLALAKNPSLADAQYFLDEIRSEKTTRSEPLPALAQPKTKSPATQQVSGTVPTTRPVVTPATPARRPAVQPHVGYEELPPPAEMMDDTSAMLSNPGDDSGAVTQIGYIPVTTTTAGSAPPNTVPPMKLVPAPTANGAQLRVNTTTQFPLSR